MANKLSIIIRTIQDRFELFKEAFASLQNQTNQNFDLIIIANSSNYKNEIKNHCGGEKIKIETINKLNQVEAAIKGIELVETPYFSFLDDDDLIQPKGLDFGLKILEEEEECAFVCTGMSLRDLETPNGDRGNFLVRNVAANKLPPHFRILKTDVYFEVGGFDSDIHFCIDHCLLLKYANTFHKFVLKTDPQFNYWHRNHNKRLSIKYSMPQALYKKILNLRYGTERLQNKSNN